MRLGLVINDLATEAPEYTTVVLARAAAALHHELWMMDVEDLLYEPTEGVGAYARKVQPGVYEDGKILLDALRADDCERRRIHAKDLDVLLLRNDPAVDMDERPWAGPAAILFGQLAVRSGTLVFNDPQSLASAINKTYFQQFPEQVRPRTLITRSSNAIKEFVAEQGGVAVVKPLQGSGGRNVFVVDRKDYGNVNQMVAAVKRDGFVVAQEYLPEARNGDVRMFLLNGRPLMADGHVAAMRRVNAEGDARSNIHAGGHVEPVEVTPEMLALADAVRPKLVADGLFLVGIDIVGNKLMEVNVFSPGGLHTLQRLTGVDFAGAVIAELEHKVLYRESYGPSISNREYATI